MPRDRLCERCGAPQGTGPAASYSPTASGLKAQLVPTFATNAERSARARTYSAAMKATMA
eukprot:356118-Chlamydomonas_euryale.AAC.1